MTVHAATEQKFFAPTAAELVRVIGAEKTAALIKAWGGTRRGIGSRNRSLLGAIIGGVAADRLIAHYQMPMKSAGVGAAYLSIPLTMREAQYPPEVYDPLVIVRVAARLAGVSERTVYRQRAAMAAAAASRGKDYMREALPPQVLDLHLSPRQASEIVGISATRIKNFRKRFPQGSGSTGNSNGQ